MAILCVSICSVPYRPQGERELMKDHLARQATVSQDTTVMATAARPLWITVSRLVCKQWPIES